MKDLRIGLQIVAPDGPAAVEAIVAAERAGIECAWMTSGAPSVDPLLVFSAAAPRTERIEMGSSIILTFPRHPLALAQEAWTLDQFAPGRLRLGVGPSGPRVIEPFYGIPYERPTEHLREYLAVLKSVLQEGTVDFQGKRIRARVRIPGPTGVKVMASALRRRSFRLCGEVTDGAISWMCTPRYLSERAVPAMADGAAAAGRERPPLIAQLPVVVSTNEAAVRSAVPVQFGFYLKVSMYQAMFRDAGFPEAAEGTFADRLVDELAVWGDEETVQRRLAELPALGID
ncbi:MAG: LLM class flavin-dependent oxidoreductase, partial [Dehalococcoidia bacterium]